MTIGLSENKRVESRQAYSFLDLLGDFGGFNDAIYFLVSLPMGYYSQAMYERQVAGEMKQAKRKRRRDSSRNLRLSIAGSLTSSQEGVNAPRALGESDVALIKKSIMNNFKERVKIPFLKALFYSNGICCRDR